MFCFSLFFFFFPLMRKSVDKSELNIGEDRRCRRKRLYSQVSTKEGPPFLPTVMIAMAPPPFSFLLGG